MTKRNADDVLSQVNKILKKYLAQLDQEEEDKVDTETEEVEEELKEELDRIIEEEKLKEEFLRIIEEEKEGDEMEEGESASIPETHIKYSPQSPEVF
jgi:hypothetical protein